MNASAAAPPVPVLRHPWGGPTELAEILERWGHLLPTGRVSGGIFSYGAPVAATARTASP